MPVVPFIPAIAKVGSAVVGGIMSRRAQKQAMERSPEEQQQLAGATQGANTAMQQGKDLTNMGMPWLNQAGGYYSTLLRGNRAAMSQATAAPRAALTDTYRGAERSLERSGVQGAARDLAQGQLARDRASKIAGLTTGVQPYAADSLAKLGSETTGQGLQGAYAGGRLYTD